MYIKDDPFSDCGVDGLKCNDPSLTRIEFAADSDIHHIIDRFMRTGQLPLFADRQTYESAEGLPETFEDLMQTTVAASQAFEQLPLDVRNRFNNDPVAYAEYLASQESKDSATPPPSPEPEGEGSAPEPPKE